MIQLHHIQTLIIKDFKSEFRNKNSLISALVFILSNTYITYLLTQNQLTTSTWVVFYWVIHLFTSFTVVQQSFSQENRAYLLYLYTLVKPMNYALSKIVIYSFLLFSLSIVSLIIWYFLGIEINQFIFWILLLAIQSIILASILTLTSFMSFKVSGNFSFIAILSLPIILPSLMIVAKISRSLLDNIPFSMFSNYFYSEGLLMIISAALAFLLFPYIWQE